MTIDEQYHEIPRAADERATLSAFLDWQRSTLEWKCSGVNDAGMRRAAAEPSNLTLLGLLRHMAEVERGWFRRTVNGEDAPPLWTTDEHEDADFEDVATADIDEAWSAWRDECEAARAIQAAHSLDQCGAQRDGHSVSVRWVMVHMIEEYSRHNGHADLLRERVDGTTGYSA